MSDILAELFGSNRKTEYTADFLSASELLSRWNFGFCLDGQRSLTIQNSTKNAIIFGATGNFKSSGILIPSILKMRGRSSLVINDPSGELLLKTSGALKKAGYSILILNYCFPEKSIGYNPLKWIKTPSAIKKLSKMTVRNSLGSSSDPFWNIAAEAIISLFVELVLQNTPQEYHNLYNVYFLISTFAHNPEKVDKLFVDAGPAILTEYKAFLSYSDKTLASILATARAALSIFGTDKTVIQVCSHDSIDVSAFRRQKIALFINTSVEDMNYYSLITSLFLQQFLSEVMSHLPDKRKKELPIFFLIDEASSLYFNQLQITVANVRKYNAGILQIYQSPSQLIDLYGVPAAKAITENCFARVYMPGQPISICQELETTLGKFEYLDDKKVRHVRPLLSANEIRELEQSLIFCGNHRAIKTATTPYFKQIFKNRLTKLPPYESDRNLPLEYPPLIQLPD